QVSYPTRLLALAPCGSGVVVQDGYLGSAVSSIVDVLPPPNPASRGRPVDPPLTVEIAGSDAGLDHSCCRYLGLSDAPLQTLDQFAVQTWRVADRRGGQIVRDLQLAAQHRLGQRHVRVLRQVGAYIGAGRQADRHVLEGVPRPLEPV